MKLRVVQDSVDDKSLLKSTGYSMLTEGTGAVMTRATEADIIRRNEVFIMIRLFRFVFQMYQMLFRG